MSENIPNRQIKATDSRTTINHRNMNTNKMIHQHIVRKQVIIKDRRQRKDILDLQYQQNDYR